MIKVLFSFLLCVSLINAKESLVLSLGDFDVELFNIRDTCDEKIKTRVESEMLAIEYASMFSCLEGVINSLGLINASNIKNLSITMVGEQHLYTQENASCKVVTIKDIPSKKFTHLIPLKPTKNVYTIPDMFDKKNYRLTALEEDLLVTLQTKSNYTMIAQRPSSLSLEFRWKTADSIEHKKVIIFTYSYGC